jgi:outer membrane protein OmpA-like peptidoglycan-associated protein
VQKPAVQAASRTGGVSDKPAGGDMRLAFGPGSAELTDTARQDLLALARSLSRDASSRIQLLAYAADDGEGASKARRLSLSRALAVRAFLIDQGVRSTRMDVRALGSNVEGGPADRVDVMPQ